MSTLNAGETLQPFKPLNQLIYDSDGNLIGIQNDRANGSDLRIGGGSGVDGTFATLIATTALKLNSGATFDLYNTADQTTNYERLRADWSGNIARIYVQSAGTGADRDFRVGTATLYHTYQQRTAASPFVSFVYTSTTSTNSTGINQLSSGTVTAASGTQTPVSIAPTINQSGTAGYTALDINPTETATGSGTKLLLRAAVANNERFRVDNLGLAYANSFIAVTTTGIGWASGFGATTDLRLVRDNASELALRSGAAKQIFRVYNTYTDASNYRRWDLSWNTTTAIMQVVGAGTGTNGNLAVGNAALATTDTVGYFMIPSSAGAPTGVPADIPTGQVALHFDSTNNKLYVYDGGWLSTAALT